MTVSALFAATVAEYESEPALRTPTGPWSGRGGSTAAPQPAQLPDWPPSGSGAGAWSQPG